METTNNATPFQEKDVNWDELAAIGILHENLAASGELDTLLRGEDTNSISLSLILLGVGVEMDATLRLIRKGEEAILEINGIKPTKSKKK
jgi:hypothetical protein